MAGSAAARIVAETRGERENETMARDDRDRDDRRGGSSGGGSNKQRPWHLFLVTKEEDREGNIREGYEQCATVWKMSEKDGFSWTQHLAIPAGSRLLLMPPKDSNGGRDRG